MSFEEYLKERAYLLPIFLCISLSTLFANMYVALSIILNKKLHNTTSFFIISTSFTGMFVSIFNIPFESIYVIEGFQWNYGLKSCIFWYTADLSNCSIDLISFTIVSYIRLKSIRYPHKPWAPMHIRIIILASVWLIPIISWALINIILMSRFPPSSNDCYPNFSPLYSIALLIVLFIMPMLILLGVNVAIILELRKRVLKMNSHHANRRRFAAVTAIAAVVPVTTLGDNSPAGLNLSSNADCTGVMDEKQQQQQKSSSQVKNAVIKNPRFNLSREKKAMIALAFIQSALIVCWTPYITILPMDWYSVPSEAEATFYFMGYSFSLINPIILILSSDNYSYLYHRFRNFIKERNFCKKFKNLLGKSSNKVSNSNLISNCA